MCFGVGFGDEVFEFVDLCPRDVVCFFVWSMVIIEK